MQLFPMAAGAPPFEIKSADLALRDVWPDGTFEGYASLFDREDLGRDVILKGAFRATLATRGAAGVRLLYQHDPARPIGVWERLHEDARGLFARGRLATSARGAREVLALMREGAVDGLSIGFKATRAVRDRRTGARRIAAIDLWEISVVTFPMQPDARIRRDPGAGAAPPVAGPDGSRLLVRVAEAARLLRKS